MALAPEKCEPAEGVIKTTGRNCPKQQDPQCRATKKSTLKTSYME